MEKQSLSKNFCNAEYQKELYDWMQKMNWVKELPKQKGLKK